MTQGKHLVLRPRDRLIMPAAVLAALLLAATPLSAQQAGDLLPPSGEIAPEGELLPPVEGEPAIIPEGEQAIVPEGTEILPPVEGEIIAAPPEGDLLPPIEGEQAIAPDGGLLPPVEGGQADAAAPAEEEVVVIDPAMQPPPAPLPTGMVRVVFQNRSNAPLDIFLDAMDGSDPAWVLTLAGGFQVVQPSAVGQTWRLAQHDQWMGGFVPDATPTQILPFTGQP